jgi:hypothetical protein
VTSGSLSDPLSPSTNWLVPGSATGATVKIRVVGERAGDRGEQIISATINLF